MQRRYCKSGTVATEVIGGVKVTAEEGLVVVYYREERLVFGLGEARLLANIVRGAGDIAGLARALLVMAGASVDEISTSGSGPGADADAPETISKGDVLRHGMEWRSTKKKKG